MAEKQTFWKNIEHSGFLNLQTSAHGGLHFLSQCSLSLRDTTTNSHTSHTAAAPYGGMMAVQGETSCCLILKLG